MLQHLIKLDLHAFCTELFPVVVEICLATSCFKDNAHFTQESEIRHTYNFEISEPTNNDIF